VLIQEANLPLIFDADALNILGGNKTWLGFLTANSILTPHPREFDRMADKCANAYERWLRQVEFSLKFNVYVVLKGAFTCITTPDGQSYFNTTGNHGMATAGSGDVLTGILLGLKAQGYNSGETAIIGVYLHGLAGDIAARRRSPEALIAGDITDALGKAWKYIR
jgi:NAD(P)H-hydrate epimerase